MDRFSFARERLMPFSPEKYKSQSGPSFYTIASLPDFMLPGYGQIVAGEKRKGILFLVAHALNLGVLGLIVFSQSLSQLLTKFSESCNFQLNQGLTRSLGELTLGSPDAFIALTIFVAFALFAARDAYEYRLKLRRRALYHDYVLAMPEAVSSSYIFHIVFLLVCMALAFFFLIPLAPPRQITDIEFIQTEENTREKPVSTVRSINNAKAAGLTKKTDPKEASHQSKAESAQKEQSAQKNQSNAQSHALTPAPPPVHDLSKAAPAAPAPPPPTPLPRPQPQSTALSKSLPKPLSKPNLMPTVALQPPLPALAKLPMPQTPPVLNQLALAPATAPSPVHLPLSAPSASTVGSAATAPRPRAQNNQNALNATQNGQPTPTPVSVLAGTGSSKSQDNGPLQLAKIGHGLDSAKGDNASGADLGPIPKRGTSGGGISSAGIGPVSGPVLQSSSGSPSNFKSNNGGQNSGERPGNSAESVSLEPDWPPYMADLQRRIKRAWYPPKYGESKRVKVMFTLHTNGEMSNLRIVTSAGLQVVDAAALKAVENAAPFRQLPAHAPASVDIEFTFDYNVFNGSLR
jgi:TonB family protein